MFQMELTYVYGLVLCLHITLEIVRANMNYTTECSNVPCPVDTVLHCLVDENWKKGQTCKPPILIQAGMCPYYNSYQGNLDARKCEETSNKSHCPRNSIFSNEGNQYQNCMMRSLPPTTPLAKPIESTTEESAQTESGTYRYGIGDPPAPPWKIAVPISVIIAIILLCIFMILKFLKKSRDEKSRDEEAAQALLWNKGGRNAGKHSDNEGNREENGNTTMALNQDSNQIPCNSPEHTDGTYERETSRASNDLKAENLEGPVKPEEADDSSKVEKEDKEELTNSCHNVQGTSKWRIVPIRGDTEGGGEISPLKEVSADKHDQHAKTEDEAEKNTNDENKELKDGMKTNMFTSEFKTDNHKRPLTTKDADVISKEATDGREGGLSLSGATADKHDGPGTTDLKRNPGDKGQEDMKGKEESIPSSDSLAETHDGPKMVKKMVKTNDDDDADDDDEDHTSRRKARSLSNDSTPNEHYGLERTERKTNADEGRKGATNGRGGSSLWNDATEDQLDKQGNFELERNATDNFTGVENNYARDSPTESQHEPENEKGEAVDLIEEHHDPDKRKTDISTSTTSTDNTNDDQGTRSEADESPYIGRSLPNDTNKDVQGDDDNDIKHALQEDDNRTDNEGKTMEVDVSNAHSINEEEQKDRSPVDSSISQPVVFSESSPEKGERQQEGNTEIAKLCEVRDSENKPVDASNKSNAPLDQDDTTEKLSDKEEIPQSNSSEVTGARIEENENSLNDVCDTKMHPLLNESEQTSSLNETPETTATSTNPTDSSENVHNVLEISIDFTSFQSERSDSGSKSGSPLPIEDHTVPDDTEDSINADNIIDLARKSPDKRHDALKESQESNQNLGDNEDNVTHGNEDDKSRDTLKESPESNQNLADNKDNVTHEDEELELKEEIDPSKSPSGAAIDKEDSEKGNNATDTK